MTDAERRVLIEQQMRHQAGMAMTGAANALEASGFDALAFAADLADWLSETGEYALAADLRGILNDDRLKMPRMRE